MHLGGDSIFISIEELCLGKRMKSQIVFYGGLSKIAIRGLSYDLFEKSTPNFVFLSVCLFPHSYHFLNRWFLLNPLNNIEKESICKLILLSTYDQERTTVLLYVFPFFIFIFVFY